jgi:hypothetical protein
VPAYALLQLDLAWLLTNHASDTSAQCEHVMEHGVVELFHDLLRSDHVEQREQAAWGVRHTSTASRACESDGDSLTLLTMMHHVHCARTLCG